MLDWVLQKKYRVAPRLAVGGNQQPNDAGAKPFDTALPVWHGPRRDKKSIGKRT